MRKFFHHLFFPHASNNHRSKVLHLDSLLITIAILIFTSFLLSSLQKEYPEVLGISNNITPIDLLNITNQIRQKNGLSHLKLDSELSQAASNKASDMFAKNYWSHVAPDGVTPWIFIKNSGYDYLYAGENLGRGFSGASEVVDAWMASPSHRDNMLSPNYNDVGYAIATGALTGNDTVLVVEMFGSRYGPKQTALAVTVNNSNTPATDTSSTPAALIITNSTPQPSQTLSSPGPEPTPFPIKQVAAIQQQPLIDKNDFTKNIAIIILVLFIVTLAIDAFIIEKKKIIRVVSHNLDHIIYLIIILLTIIVIGRGLVL